MKRMVAVWLALALVFGVSAGCSKKETGGLKEGAQLRDIVDEVSSEFGDWYVQMPAALDETTLRDILGVDPAWVDEYAGDFSMTMTSADHFVAIKAKEGKAEEIAKALENRRAQVQQNFEQYLPGPLEIAKAGKVITKGDYVFLMMLGDPEQGADQEIARAEEIVNRYFES